MVEEVFPELRTFEQTKLFNIIQLRFTTSSQIIGRETIHFETMDSTQTYALEWIAKSNPIEGTVISTDFQTAGKGQGANNWQSGRGENLLISIILRPVWLPASRQFYLSMMAAYSMHALLKTLLSPEKLSVKWPNDLYFEDNKLGGILIQNHLKGDRMEYSVIGIGLNINQLHFPPTLPNPVSLRLLTGIVYERGELQSNLIHILDQEYQYLMTGNHDRIKRLYEEKLYNRNKESVVTIRNEQIRGQILGVEEDGRLRMRVGDELKTFIH